MSTTKAAKNISSERLRFIESWRARFRHWKKVVSRDAVAKAGDMNVSTVSAFTNEGRSDSASIPDPYQQQRIASLINVSPAWLAFGAGPQDPIAAQKAYELGEKFEKVEGLAQLVAAFEKAGEPDRAMMRQLAGKFSPAPKIEIKPASVSSSLPAVEPQQSDLLPLTDQELRVFLGWLLSQVEQMPTERPLTIACWKIAMHLNRGTVPSLPPGTEAALPASKATGETSAPSAASSSPPAAHRKSPKKS